MQETENGQQPPADTPPGVAPWAVYILHLGSLFIGLTAVIGVIVAYMQRRDAAPWVQSHYQFQINTFWIGLLIFAVAIITMPLYGLGFLLGVFLTIWLLVRCIYGMRQLNAREPIPDPETWLFGWSRSG
ncbi:DUF4870 domain-containing protein [Halorhodospira sp. 9622]|uniref:DUF4870 family protein n=1 Tax=Halorhodospira sp. 9622 TaxID=2899136 RepID=UPI001EE8EE58|nr:DUF4870 domain-containing protein [Halorhodospira sp. 9622]MCG5537491.1 DUF4870 domain-containing protein [Halorhodospira sp. 9622]